MSVKASVLQALEQNRDCSLSGEELAKTLAVSRAAVWKAITKLREEGYEIEAVNNRGYRLRSENDILSAEGIKACMSNDEIQVEFYKCIDSTNREAKRQSLSMENEVVQKVIVANEQTAGRGRMGRSFYSPNDTGIYMSFLLKPHLDASDAVMLTTAASVAVCRAIRKISSLKPQIKWVNDIYIGPRKVCGILTEAISNFEVNQIEYVIVGIGINVKTKEFPEKVDCAGCLNGDEEIQFTRNSLAAEIIEQFMKLYNTIDDRSFIDDYRKWSNVIGKRIRFGTQDSFQFGLAQEIDENGGLHVLTDDGTTQVLTTGEISLRVCE